MNDNTKNHIDKLVADLDKELNTFEDWINWHIKLMSKKYPEREINTEFKDYMMSQWIDKQDEHKEKVRELHKEYLILYFAETEEETK